ncbi:class I SAM-dependent methyltransferase [Pelagibacteraceae bacterium]|jgi:cyclopropane fatty-acyl-phospholipid synthase-like methyltransferase|nr:class I SAM-dependent methyltransferase [Pelagibacteraceae bacterium]
MKYMMYCNCKIFFIKKLFSYSKKPPKEKEFNIKKKYKREYFECKNCGHIFARLFFDLKDIYNKQYFDYTYSSLDKLKTRFNFVKNLKFKNSDNKNRVGRINEYFDKKKNLDVLDIGSGMGIFLHEMKKKQWNCLGLELDKRYKKFCNEFLKIKVLNIKFQNLKINKKFNLITFNKVLEHVENPITLLKISSKFLKKDGKIYIEVPDSNVKKLGKLRDEFCIDHLHLFSIQSVSNMASRSGFSVDFVKRIIDPSGKYTIFAFLKKNKNIK